MGPQREESRATPKPARVPGAVQISLVLPAIPDPRPEEEMPSKLTSSPGRPSDLGEIQMQGRRPRGQGNGPEVVYPVNGQPATLPKAEAE